MDNKIIILMVALVIIAGVGGYFVGLYQGAGSLSLNLSNNSTGNVTNGSTSTSTHKAATVSTTKNKTTNTNGTSKKNGTSSNTTNTGK
jgi:hypothetical protein